MIKTMLALGAVLAVLIAIGASPQGSAKAPTIEIQSAVSHSIKPV